MIDPKPRKGMPLLTKGLGENMAKASKQDIKEVWTEYKKTKAETLRNILIRESFSRCI